MTPDLNNDEQKLISLEKAQQQIKVYEGILNILPDIIYKIDPDGRFVYLSKSVNVLGYRAEDLLGKHFSAIVHPDDLPSVSRDKVLPKLRGKITGDKEAPKLFDERRTGRRVTRNLLIRLVPNTATTVESEIGKSANLAMIQGEITATGLYQQNTDPGHNSFEGSSGIISISVPAQEAAEAPKPSTFYGELATFGKYDKDIDRTDKNFEGTVGVIRDVTERKMLEEKKTELEQQLFHSKKMQAIGELAGGIAHDFNNLLSILLGYTEIISMKFGDQDEALTKYTDTIISTVSQASDLTGKLLAFARKGKYSDTVLNVHTIIADTIQLLAHSIDKRISIKQEMRAPQSTIVGDANQLKNALINIAINARDAMPDGGELVFSTRNIVLDADLLREFNKKIEEGLYVAISVADTGIGMDNDVKERLFEPFFTTKGLGKGTGLGLACVDGIVDMHKGAIKVRSNVGSGSTFTLYLPVAQDGVLGVVPPLAESVKDLNGVEHILLIDDEERILDAITSILSEFGYKVTTFSDARNAIVYFQKHHDEVDIVILDMIMPVLNGKDVFAELKKVDDDVCVIISTGYSYEHQAEGLMKDGIAGFIQKPFSARKLIAAMTEALHCKR